MWRKGKPPILLVEMQMATVTMENSMEVPQKLKRAFRERLLACALGISILFGIPHTTWSGKRRGASLNFVVSNALGSFFDREITKVKILGHPWTVCSLPGSSIYGIPRQEYWSRSYSLSMGILLIQGLNLETPALQVDSLPSKTLSKMSNMLLER